MAERVGFEPTVPFLTGQLLSTEPLSTTQPSLHLPCVIVSKFIIMVNFTSLLIIKYHNPGLLLRIFAIIF